MTEETGVTKGTLDEGAWVRIRKSDGVRGEWMSNVTLGFACPPVYTLLDGLFCVVLKAGCVMLACGDKDLWGDLVLVPGVQFVLLSGCERIKTCEVEVPTFVGMVKRAVEVDRPDLDAIRRRLGASVDGLDGWDSDALLDYLYWLERDVSFDRRDS